MEEELKKLQDQLNELKSELKKNQDIINKRINERMAIIEQDNGDIYTDEEIVNLNLSSQTIERNVNKKVQQLQTQIAEITEFEDGKKVKIDGITKKINDRMEQLYRDGYSYSDVYLDSEIQKLQEEIDKIKQEKMISKVELQSAKQEYQDYKKDKQKLEKEIEEIDKTEIPQHLLEEKKQLEEEIKKLKARGRDENDPEIMEYQSDITKINEELEKGMQKSKDKKTKLAKIVKKMGELEEKYGKDKLDEPDKKIEKNSNQTNIQNQTTTAQPQINPQQQTQVAQTTVQPQTNPQQQTQTAQTTVQPQINPQQQTQTAQTTAQPQTNPQQQTQVAQTTVQPQINPQQQTQVAQTTVQPQTNSPQSAQPTQTNDSTQKTNEEDKKEYEIFFNKDGIWCDGKWMDIKKIDNLQDLVKNAKQTLKDRDVKLNFDLRGMSLVSRLLKQTSLNSEQVKKIKDLAYENRGKAEIIHGLLTKQGFMLKDFINKIKQQPLLTTNQPKKVKQIAEKAESLQNDNSNLSKVVQIPEKAESVQNNARQNFMKQIDAKDAVANSQPVQQGNTQDQVQDNDFDIPLDDNSKNDAR